MMSNKPGLADTESTRPNRRAAREHKASMSNFVTPEPEEPVSVVSTEPSTQAAPAAPRFTQPAPSASAAAVPQASPQPLAPVTARRSRAGRRTAPTKEPFSTQIERDTARRLRYLIAREQFNLTDVVDDALDEFLTSFGVPPAHEIPQTFW